MAKSDGASQTATGKRGRQAPEIPDHEVLRMIGSGSFGEVWLARTVTGVYRAVKVIWREDFDVERDFEREFEAIKRYEPISRQHPGLVDVLQVGREEGKRFYYYIMEIADDVESGHEFDPETYTPHTFRTELIHRERIELDRCAIAGAQLAEALDFLHQNDLIHRDVKLSNCIYVEGQCKLADIGLVAALGDRSFVGTEGYVPPEGAGTPAADVFSLGMVLYELATGKDRLDFPDVPTVFREQSNPALWRQLNRVICRACARRPDSRYETAGDMALALRGEKVEDKRNWLLIGAIAAPVVVIALALLAYWWPEGEPEGFEITTSPPGADVWAGEEYLGMTPVSMEEKPEEGISFEFRLEGYRNEVVEYAGATDTRAALNVELEDSKFPQPGQVWTNSLGLEFKPIPSGHRLDRPVHADLYMRYAREMNSPFDGMVVMQELPDGTERPIPIVSNRDARGFADWLQALDKAEGFIGPDYTYRAITFDEEWVEWPKKRLQYGRSTIPITPFVCLVEKQRYGSLSIDSDPPGASIFREGKEIGTTPHEIPRIKTGQVAFDLQLEGFKPAYLEGDVQPDGLLELDVVLDEGQGVQFGKRWENSLGIDFMPVGDVLIATTEARVGDFRRFCQESGYEFSWVDHADRPEMYPMDRLSREDAEAFCKWLTKFERENNWITQRHEYRLPTDVEWSSAAGLPNERGTTPATRNGIIEGIYPWGYEWPPPPGAGNFADESLLRFYRNRLGEHWTPPDEPNIIEGYDDSFPKLAWVNELNPNELGLYHVAGNVWEWVSDDYFGGGGGTQNAGTIRGGSWETAERRELLASYRRSLDASQRTPAVGFRFVLGRAQDGN